MAEITAALVKELRETSGAGMMDCKKALAETDGNIEAAQDWLRTKGLAAAAKKSGRIASEGLVGVATDGNTGAIVEVNSETDFVSRNEIFQNFVKTVADIALKTGGNIDDLNSAQYPGTGRTVAEEITHLISTIGENMNIRRVAVQTVDGGAISTYVHGAIQPGLGKIGVLVATTGADLGAADAIGKQVAMHIAATNPQSLSQDDLDPAIVEREKAVLTEQARESGKPDDIIEKMIEGRIRKFYEEVCLLDQTFVIDGESKVKKAVEAAGKDLAIKAFIRFGLGEGIEKKEEDFAAEVAAAVGG
ncbi:MAG: translation elongation factor Ts [Rhodospirillaceae bacterium]|nr:translation elongation factor Ts [Rhodospirillaceae bacterium]MDH5772456.1 translation elongation factor Ts [Rhodospirillaceae bacterium]